MAITRCKKDNRPGYKWSGSAKCHCYNPTSKSSETMARNKATNEGIKTGDFLREVMDRLRKLRSK